MVITSTTLAVVVGAGALTEYALGRWGGPRWSSVAISIGSVLKTLATPTLGKLPVIGALVLSILDAVSPAVGPTCMACAGSGALPAAPKPPVI